MRLALDTNVISELTKPASNERVRVWIRGLDSMDLFLPAPCWAELQRGLRLLPAGRRRAELDGALEALLTGLGGILPFGRREAEAYAELSTQPGRPRPTLDAMIAAVCRAHEMPLATRNVHDFEGCGVEIINPWDEPP